MSDESISVRLRHFLRNYESLKEISEISEEYLLRANYNFGRKTLLELKEFLAQKGYYIKKEIKIPPTEDEIKVKKEKRKLHDALRFAGIGCADSDISFLDTKEDIYECLKRLDKLKEEGNEKASELFHDYKSRINEYWFIIRNKQHKLMDVPHKDLMEFIKGWKDKND